MESLFSLLASFMVLVLLSQEFFVLTLDLDWIVLQREGIFIERTATLCKVGHMAYLQSKAHYEQINGQNPVNNNCLHNSVAIHLSSELPPVKKPIFFLLTLQSYELASDQRKQQQFTSEIYSSGVLLV